MESNNQLFGHLYKKGELQYFVEESIELHGTVKSGTRDTKFGFRKIILALVKLYEGWSQSDNVEAAL